MPGEARGRVSRGFYIWKLSQNVSKSAQTTTPNRPHNRCALGGSMLRSGPFWATWGNLGGPFGPLGDYLRVLGSRQSPFEGRPVGMIVGEYRRVTR